MLTWYFICVYIEVSHALQEFKNESSVPDCPFNTQQVSAKQRNSTVLYIVSKYSLICKLVKKN